MSKELEDGLHKILEWIWDHITAPILRYMPMAKRVIWCPSGPLSFLPLHAAGYHRNGTGKTVMDQVVSCYTATFRTLKHARENDRVLDEFRVLIAAVTRRELKTAEAEAKLVKNAISKGVSENITVLNRVSRASLTKALPDFNVHHFICHAKADLDPSKSRLILTRGETITLSELARFNYKAGALAYLSACSTSAGQTGPWLDEGLTLTNAFQVAGFARVVGTVWDAEAFVSMEVAERFYLSLQGDVTRAPLALHAAVRQVRSLKLNEPSCWASYVYAGC